MLKATICLLLLGFIAVPAAYAKDMCTEFSSFAKTVMSARQSGVSLSKMMSLAEKNCNGATGDDKKACEVVTPVLKSIVINAYKKPHFSTESYKQRAISDYSNAVYLQCYEATHKE